MSEITSHQAMSPAEREAVDQLLARAVRSRDSIEQALDFLDHLVDSGNLAAVGGFLEDFDENFGAITRPDLMTLIANLMMVMGALSRIDYAPFFSIAMKTPDSVNAAYPAFEERTEKLQLGEAMRLLRSPEIAGALEMLVAVLRSLRPETDTTA